MYPPILSKHTWLSLSLETRNKLREIFDIARSGGVEVVDGRVFSDGTTPEDLMSLTSEKMQEYLGSKSTDFNTLFNECVKKIETPIGTIEITPPLDAIVPPEEQSIAPDVKDILKRRSKNIKTETNA